MKNIIRNILIAFVGLALVFYGVGKVANIFTKKESFKKIAATKKLNPKDSLIETVKVNITNSKFNWAELKKKEGNDKKETLFININTKSKENIEKDILKVITKLQKSKLKDNLQGVNFEINKIETNDKGEDLELGKVGVFYISARELNKLSLDELKEKGAFNLKNVYKYWDKSK
ncbi:hypothetical protein HAHI6034_02745 [Hathewaya histolytica]|uniref:Uncharacterized protein n=1 Tax=Hathewaya histolytica TaxID=1498 RepID=A0A4V6KDW0_HATHI|nr:hypothetical protein [Hathewaya histolytica]VTQ90497.1 Uncharacterised protein [Hathewaya histolytica]